MKIGIIYNGIAQFNRTTFRNKKCLINYPKKNFSNILEIFQNKLNMLFAPRKFANKVLPVFQELSDGDIYNNTGINPKWTYRNAIIWTPRFYIQKDLSTEFIFQLKKFRKLTEWTDLHQVALTQLILTEAIRDTTYEIAYNYKVEPSVNNPFHGLIDILIYNNDPEANQSFYPLVPIVFPKYVKEEGIYYERYSNAQIIGISSCLLKNYKLNHSDDEIQLIKAFQTNGHDWCLFEVHEHHVKRTNFFRPNLPHVLKNKMDNAYQAKFFDDFDHIRAVLGLIRYALNIEDNMVLKTSIYSLSEKDEHRLIQNKEAISMLKSDAPDVIENVGVNDKLLKGDEQPKISDK